MPQCSSQGFKDQGYTHQTGKWALLLVYKYCIQVPSQPVLTCQCVSCFGLTLVIKEKNLTPFLFLWGSVKNFRTALKFLSSENYLTSQFSFKWQKMKRGNYSKMSQDNVCWRRKPVLICQILLLGFPNWLLLKIFTLLFNLKKSPSNLQVSNDFWRSDYKIMLGCSLLKGLIFLVSKNIVEY